MLDKIFEISDTNVRALLLMEYGTLIGIRTHWRNLVFLITMDGSFVEVCYSPADKEAKTAEIQRDLNVLELYLDDVDFSELYRMLDFPGQIKSK